MKRYGTMGQVVLLLALGLALATTAAARGWGHRGDFLWRLEHALEGLDLEQAKRTAVYEIIDKARAEQRELRRQLRAAYEALRALLEQDLPDESAVLTQADRIGELQTKLRQQTLRTLLAVRAQLTPEQRARLREALHKPRERHRGGER
ncbi:MAG: hypothetical protein KatS3mg131_3109 [Candidatus Tectimicrobiota bacterium]|nr:MAG: hypothetical protein KatS3mg131_3109 [Candidatus Tectomicrobia bacterium]